MLCVSCCTLCCYRQSGRFQIGICRTAVEESQTDKRRQLERRGVIRHSHSNRAALSSLLTALQQQSLLPTVVFAFSKRVCEDSAYLLHHVDLTSHGEKSAILVFFNTAIKRLHRQDRVLPQVLHVKEMSVRGICTHHAGMLPILKEVVEMLFGRGLIKGEQHTVHQCNQTLHVSSTQLTSRLLRLPALFLRQYCLLPRHSVSRHTPRLLLTCLRWMAD